MTGRSLPFHEMFVLITLMLLAASGIACVAEEPPEPAEEPGVWDEVQSLYEKAKETGETLPRDVTEWVKQDYEKRGDWEYLVVEVAGAGPRQLQMRLNGLGEDRWECIWIDRRGEKTVLFFKRPVRNYLQQIPFNELMKVLPLPGGE